MFPIPSYDISAAGTLCLSFGLVGTISALAVLRSKWRERKDVPFDTVFKQRKSVEETPTQFLVGAFLASLVLVVTGSYLTIAGASEVYKFRHLPLESLQELKIQKYSVDGADPRTVSLDDTELVRSGLRMLSDCVRYEKGREKFDGGYKFALIYEDPKLHGNSLIYNTRDASRTPSSIVSPTTGNGLNLGQYRCDQFEKWVADNVDPLFVNRTD